LIFRRGALPEASFVFKHALVEFAHGDGEMLPRSQEVAKPQIDALLDEAGSSSDEQKRLADYEKIGQFIVDQVPTVPLYQMDAIYGAAKALNFQPTPNESFFLNRMSWAG